MSAEQLDLRMKSETTFTSEYEQKCSSLQDK